MYTGSRYSFSSNAMKGWAGLNRPILWLQRHAAFGSVAVPLFRSTSISVERPMLRLASFKPGCPGGSALVSRVSDASSSSVSRQGQAFKPSRRSSGENPHSLKKLGDMRLSSTNTFDLPTSSIASNTDFLNRRYLFISITSFVSRLDISCISEIDSARLQHILLRRNKREFL